MNTTQMLPLTETPAPARMVLITLREAAGA